MMDGARASGVELIRFQAQHSKMTRDDVAMKCSSIHDNLPRGQVLYLDRVIIHSKMTKFVDIPSPLPEQNSPIPS